MHSTCRIEAVRTDGVGLFDDEVLSAVRKLPVPLTLLWAARGLMDEEQGLYDEKRLAVAGLGDTRVEPVAVPDVNHYTVLTGGAGAQEIATRLVALANTPVPGNA